MVTLQLSDFGLKLKNLLDAASTWFLSLVLTWFWMMIFLTPFDLYDHDLMQSSECLVFYFSFSHLQSENTILTKSLTCSPNLQDMAPTDSTTTNNWMITVFTRKVSKFRNIRH